MSQTRTMAHIEALTQNIVGLLIAFVVMKVIGVETTAVLKIQVSLFILSYIRSYGIRRFFNWLHFRKLNNVSKQL